MRQILLLLLVACLPAWCLPDGVAELAARLSRRPSFECDFRQERSLPGMRTPLRSSGTFQLEPGRRALWNQKIPVAQRILIRPDGMELVRPDGTSQKISSATPIAGDLVRTLFALSQGDLQGLSRNFEVSWLRSGRSDWSLRLLPRGALAKAVREIVLSGGDDLRKVRMTDGQGLPTLIEFGAPRALGARP